MYPMKIVDRKAKHKANKQGYCRKSPRFVVVMVVVLSCFYVQPATAEKILMETGFEDLVQPPAESSFQPSIEIVKNGKRSLEIFFEGDDRINIDGHPLEANASIVSLECWVYIESGEKSFAISMHAADKLFDNDLGGPHIEWYDGDIRYRVLQGDPWREIVAYPVDEWHYVRIVANFSEDVFDFYTGMSREEALASRPKRQLEFQAPATAPQPRWFLILAEAMDARGYMDDLVIYEGDEPPNLAVESAAKLTTLWGKLKGW